MVKVAAKEKTKRVQARTLIDDLWLLVEAKDQCEKMQGYTPSNMPYLLKLSDEIVLDMYVEDLAQRRQMEVVVNKKGTAVLTVKLRTKSIVAGSAKDLEINEGMTTVQYWEWIDKMGLTTLVPSAVQTVRSQLLGHLRRGEYRSNS